MFGHFFTYRNFTFTMDDTKPFWHLFRHNRNDEKPSETEIEAKLKEQIQALVRNGIFFDFEKRKLKPSADPACIPGARLFPTDRPPTP